MQNEHKKRQHLILYHPYTKNAPPHPAQEKQKPPKKPTPALEKIHKEKKPPNKVYKKTNSFKE